MTIMPLRPPAGSAHGPFLETLWFFMCSGLAWASPFYFLAMGWAIWRAAVPRLLELIDHLHPAFVSFVSFVCCTNLLCPKVKFAFGNDAVVLPFFGSRYLCWLKGPLNTTWRQSPDRKPLGFLRSWAGKAETCSHYFLGIKTWGGGHFMQIRQTITRNSTCLKYILLPLLLLLVLLFLLLLLLLQFFSNDGIQRYHVYIIQSWLSPLSPPNIW